LVVLVRVLLRSTRLPRQIRTLQHWNPGSVGVTSVYVGVVVYCGDGLGCVWVARVGREVGRDGGHSRGASEESGGGNRVAMRRREGGRLIRGYREGRRAAGRERHAGGWKMKATD